MDYNKSNNGNCDQCEADFQNEIQELVDNVEKHTRNEHSEKQQEVESAFTAGNTQEPESDGSAKQHKSMSCGIH